MTGEMRGRLQDVFPRHPDEIYAAALSADGRFAILPAAEWELTLWDVAARRVLQRLRGSHERTYSMALTPDGKRLASLTVDGELRLWDLTGGTSTDRVTGHVERAWCVTFSPDGRRLVTTGREGTVRIWDVEAWTERTLLAGLTSAPRLLAFPGDGSVVEAVDRAGFRVRWDVGLGKLTGTARPSTQRFFDCYAENGGWYARTEFGSSVLEVVPVGSPGRARRIHRIHPTDGCLALSRDGRRLAAFELITDGINESLFRLFDSRAGRELARFSLPRDAPLEETTMRMTVGSKRPVVAGRTVDSRIWVWDTSRGIRRSLVIENGRPEENCDIELSPDETLIATCGPERVVTLLDAATLRPIRRLYGHVGDAFDVAFSPDGQTLASAAADRTVRLWNVATGLELMTLEGHTGSVRRVRFAADGRTLASAAAAADGTGEVILWRASAPEPAEGKPATLAAAVPP